MTARLAKSLPLFLFLAGLPILIAASVHADSVDLDDAAKIFQRSSSESETNYSRFFSAEEFTPWKFEFAVNGGYNQLIKGYKGYTNLGNAGIDLYITPGRLRDIPPGWRDHMSWRLSADYFPLQVPKGVNGLTEDLYGVYASLIVKSFSLGYSEAKQWAPFLGVGAGHYLDHVTLDTPASGKVSGTHNYFGANLSAGVFTPEFGGSLRLVPEIRFHMLKIPDNSWATNMTYQLALAYGF